MMLSPAKLARHYEGADKINQSLPGDLRITRPEARKVHERLKTFIRDEVIPAEQKTLLEMQQLPTSPTANWAASPRWTYHSKHLETLKASAKKLNLWNLFLPAVSGLTNVEYAYCAELTGRYLFAPSALNCAAPDTGNMEVLHMYGNPAQKEKWLKPLLAGEIRSAFLMTEPAVASSDARNIELTIQREGDEYVLNGRKWWSSGACDPLCKVAIVMGRVVTPGTPQETATAQETSTATTHPRKSANPAPQTMLVVPFDTPGITLARPLSVYGFDDAPHGHAEVLLKDVRVSVKTSLLLGEGRGFEIAQGRLGPGRIHHCMRAVGLGERALQAAALRASGRQAFGRPIAVFNLQNIAEMRIQLDLCRLLVLDCAAAIDRSGARIRARELLPGRSLLRLGVQKRRTHTHPTFVASGCVVETSLGGVSWRRLMGGGGRTSILFECCV